MTTRQKIEELLYNRGIFESQAKSIMDYAIPKIDSEMRQSGESLITWDRPSDEYPDALYAALFIAYINQRVVEWAKENLPKAWWIPMFEK